MKEVKELLGLKNHKVKVLLVEEIEEESAETEEQKSFNDVNYWKPEVKDDDSMKNILNDLDLD